MDQKGFFLKLFLHFCTVTLAFSSSSDANQSSDIKRKIGFTLEQGIPHFNTKPYFLTPPSTNSSALSGQSAYLHCRVAQLGDKKVSWIRGRDLHVLTSGLQTFASDERFQSLHHDRSENWTLHIRFSQTRDGGEYQCQVNTEPRISMSFYLKVTEASTIILGSDQRYIKTGSHFRLSCKTNVPSPQPGLLYWYKDSELLEEGSRVSIKTEFGGVVSSHLEIQVAGEMDSGNYTCWPTKFNPSSAMVHVIRDERPAAMSHGTLNNGGTRNEPSSGPPEVVEFETPPLVSSGRVISFPGAFGHLAVLKAIWNLR